MSQARLAAVLLAFPLLLAAGKAPRAPGAAAGGDGKNADLRAAVLHYLKDGDAADWKAVYADLCADDRGALSADEYVEKHKGLSSPLAQEVVKTATHSIQKIETSGDTATVTVENTFLDEGTLMKHAKARGFDPLSDDERIKARADELMLAEAKSAHPPRKSRAGPLTLRHEADGWKVDEGWKKTMLLAPHAQKGTDLWMAGKLAEARAEFEEILKLDPGNKNATFMIQLIDEKAAKKKSP